MPLWTETPQPVHELSLLFRAIFKGQVDCQLASFCRKKLHSSTPLRLPVGRLCILHSKECGCNSREAHYHNQSSQVHISILSNQYAGTRRCHAGTEHRQQAICPMTTVVGSWRQSGGPVPPPLFSHPAACPIPFSQTGGQRAASRPPAPLAAVNR